MFVTEIIRMVCMFVGRDDLVDIVDSELVYQDKEVHMILRCLNLTLNEIATDYIPFLFTEKMKVQGNRINVENFSKKFFEIVNIKDKNNTKVKYKMFPDYISLKADEVEVTYKYIPQEVSLMDEIDINGVPSRVIAYGAAMEYCIISMLTDEAEIWQKRYRDGLKIAARKKTEMRLPKRRWLL